LLFELEEECGRVLHGGRTARGCVEAEIVKRPEVGGASDDRIKDPSRQRKSASGWRLGREGTTQVRYISKGSRAGEQTWAGTDKSN
jgi:hypothetical protein